MENQSSKARSLGIYVHIPFCVQKCKYCDFCSFPKCSDELKQDYKSALISEIKVASKSLKHHCVDSIFFGGGTPTCLSASSISDVLCAIFNNFCVSDEAEITLECNPATAKEKDFAVLRAAGFNRLSLGLQSVHKIELSTLGRIHSFADFVNTYNDARRAGFNNINVDLMYGIPHQTLQSFEKTLKTLVELSPEHISAYSLNIEPKTEFFSIKDSLPLPSEDEEYDMYRLADSYLEGCGYSHYEISNYAMSNKESKHNLKYWSCDEYIGLGIASHSFIGMTRFSSTTSISSYIDRFKNGADEECRFIEESLSPEELAEEYIMMRLRLKDGLSKKSFYERFGFELDGKYIERMNPFIKSGHIISTDGGYSLTADGMYVSNYILSEILDLGT